MAEWEIAEKKKKNCSPSRMAIKNHDKKKFSFCHHSADRIAECEIAERRKCRSASTHEKKDVLILPAEWQKKKQRKKKCFHSASKTKN